MVYLSKTAIPSFLKTSCSPQQNCQPLIINVLLAELLPAAFAVMTVPIILRFLLINPLTDDIQYIHDISEPYLDETVGRG